MDSTLPIEICRVCNGDPRASEHCKACRGSQVGLPTSYGYAVWAEPLNGFAFGFRRWRARMNAFLNVICGLVVASCVGLFAWMLLRVGPQEALTMDFWFSGRWYVTVLWLGWILACFFIFRLQAYRLKPRIMPAWGKTQVERLKMQEQTNVRRALDVSVYFQSAAWQVLEQAYELASKLGRTEVLPVHVFAAVLASPAGGIFTTRLGLDYQKIKEGLLDLLRAGPPGSPTAFSVEVKSVLLRAFADADHVHRQHVGTIELFVQAFLADPALQEVFDAAGYPVKHVLHVAEWIRMQEQMQEEYARFITLARMKPAKSMNRTMTARTTPLLDRLSEDLTALAREGYLAPLIGRDEEMESLLRAIESGKHSVAIVGEAGVGKRAIVEGLARRMVEEDVPEALFDKRLVSVDIPQLLSSGEPGQATEHLLVLLNEVGQSGNIILVVHGIEAFVGPGFGGTIDLAEAFATDLDKGHFPAIAPTYPQAWHELPAP